MSYDTLTSFTLDLRRMKITKTYLDIYQSYVRRHFVEDWGVEPQVYEHLVSYVATVAPFFLVPWDVQVATAQPLPYDAVW